VLLRGLPARDDRLQENRVLVLDERHQVHAVFAPDDKDALPGVSIRVRVLQDVEQVAALDVEDDLLEPDAALRPELRVLRVVPIEELHRDLASHTVCLIGTRWHRLQCARQCAQTRSEEHQSAPNANQGTNKKRA
jgi:hypothetical protein